MAGITSRSALLELARSIGRPVPSPSGEVVKELIPKCQSAAARGTLSGTYGTGSFPLHTDTAFWPLPARYVVLRTRGDTRRHTSVLTFADLFREGTKELRALADRAVWLVRTPSKSFYCSMRFRSGKSTGWRYDGQCMLPSNDSAIKVQEMLCTLFSCDRINQINWTGDMAVVLCNWEVLHGRGPSPPDEKIRIVERIYVE